MRLAMDVDTVIFPTFRLKDSLVLGTYSNGPNGTTTAILVPLVYYVI